MIRDRFSVESRVQKRAFTVVNARFCGVSLRVNSLGEAFSHNPTHLALVISSMTKNPFYNATAALAYIVLVASIIYTLTKTASDQPDNNFLIPVFMLSLLVLSVSTMSYLFFYQPLLLFLKGEQELAVSLFLKTVAVFAAFTVLVFIVTFLVVPLLFA